MTLPNPYTRKEKILKNIAEGTQDFPDAQTREELYLIDIAKKSKGGTLTPVATQSSNGLMSSTDKTKLDGITAGAKPYDKASNEADGLMSKEHFKKLNELGNATDSKPGLMKQAAHVNKPSGEEPSAIKVSLDSLISNLQAAGIIL